MEKCALIALYERKKRKKEKNPLTCGTTARWQALLHFYLCITVPLTLFQGNAGLGTLEKGTHTANTGEGGTWVWKKRLGIISFASSKLSVPVADRLPFYPDLPRVHAAVGHRSVLLSCLHSDIFSIASLGRGKPLFDLGHIPEQGGNATWVKRRGLGLLLFFLADSRWAPRRLCFFISQTRAKNVPVFPDVVIKIILF